LVQRKRKPKYHESHPGRELVVFRGQESGPLEMFTNESLRKIE
jgi:hypothetical protein